MRAYPLCFSLAMAFLLLKGVAVPQSLGDLARTTEEQRQETKTPSKVYTNGDLKRDPGSAPSPTGTSPQPATEAKRRPSTSTATEASKADAKDGSTAQEPPKVQKYWKDRITEPRSQLTRNKPLLDAVQTRLNSLAADIISRDDPAQRTMLERNRQDTVREMDRLKKDIQDQTKAIKGHRRGSPPCERAARLAEVNTDSTLRISAIPLLGQSSGGQGQRDRRFSQVSI